MAKYRLVCFMRIDCEDSEIEPMTLEEAEAELENQRMMQPENLYKIEKLDQEDDNVGSRDACLP